MNTNMFLHPCCIENSMLTQQTVHPKIYKHLSFSSLSGKTYYQKSHQVMKSRYTGFDFSNGSEIW